MIHQDVMLGRRELDIWKKFWLKVESFLKTKQVIQNYPKKWKRKSSYFRNAKKNCTFFVITIDQTKAFINSLPTTIRCTENIGPSLIGWGQIPEAVSTSKVKDTWLIIAKSLVSAPAKSLKLMSKLLITRSGRSEPVKPTKDQWHKVSPSCL